MSLNVVNLVGRCGGDPDMRYFENGGVLCRLTLAVNRPTKNDDQPDWFSLEIWGKRAETAGNYIRKGSLLGIQGQLSIDTWTDRNTGAQRSAPKIRVDNFRFLGSRRDNDPSNMGGGGGGGSNFDEF
ncbi:MAG: single-stranded DNA-binding protein [Cyanobacteria bacterium P01_D01_bin.73]